ncbi:MAG TPA: methyltransferase domain-containing protein [Mycobacteriales bacterium]|nr:methyltransferase domain-containing protein [Mycobacteriales bacterium]
MAPHRDRVLRFALPPVLGAAAMSRRTPPLLRAGAAAGLIATWAEAYTRYRRRGLRLTHQEYEKLRTATLEAFNTHYNENVPTIEEEFDLWGDYHAYRHEMRYDLVADMVRQHVPSGGVVLDIGCGAALVADRLEDLDLTYVGVEYGGHQLKFAVDKARERSSARIRRWFSQGDAEHLPIADRSVDVVVMSEVIEHLLRPELAVWEIARVLRPGGVFVMTTNNASEMPLYSPTSHVLAWLEKAFGFYDDRLISHRPWIWPEHVAVAVLPDGSQHGVFLPHTWHKQAETRRMFAAAGLDTFHASTFEFPPPQSKTSRWLSGKGSVGTRTVDVIETVCRSIPLVNRLGCHVFMVARRVDAGAPTPPPGIWPGPFSEQPNGERPARL